MSSCVAFFSGLALFLTLNLPAQGRSVPTPERSCIKLGIKTVLPVRRLVGNYIVGAVLNHYINEVLMETTLGESRVRLQHVVFLTYTAVLLDLGGVELLSWG